MLISVVIPTLNEAARLDALLLALRALQDDTVQLEIIVSDGGSSDGTAEIARQRKARVVCGARGRGAQLQAGAQIANGEALWFVHADALPHPRSAAHIARCLKNSALCGGNFRLQFQEGSTAARLFVRIARHQRRWGIYYGDSGTWVRREVYEALGGFTLWPLFEDYDFARRMEKFARHYKMQTDYAPWPIFVSARRFAHQPARVLAQWLLLQFLFGVGVNPARLAQLYYQGKME